MFCTDGEYFRSLIDNESLARARYSIRRTAAKWRDHLDDLHATGILEEEDLTNVQVVSTYFAVVKTAATARVIFYGARISTCLSTPPAVNLPPLPLTLRRIAQTFRLRPWATLGTSFISSA